MSFSWRARNDAHSPKPERLPWKDYAPPEAQAVDKMIAHFRQQPTGPRHCIPITEPESEERPHSAEKQSSEVADAPGADRLDQIATLVRLLTYGEVMDLAAALWQMRPEGKEVTEQELPGMWHRWAKEDSKSWRRPGT